jgi:fumarate hydratase class II
VANGTRTEKDPLGEVTVPADALYGVQTERARQNFPVSGLRSLPAFIRATVWIKKAAALTHQETGRLDAERAGAIIKAADEILAGQHFDHFVVDVYQAGAGTSHNMNVNEVLANRANELLGRPRGSYAPVHPNDHVNMAQSTNDVIPTAIRLSCLSQLAPLVSAGLALARAFRDKGGEFDGIVKAGRTHLQDAMPIRLGQELRAYAESIERALRRVVQAAAFLRDLGIGGSAVGTGVNVEPAYPALMVRHLRELSGLELHEGRDRVQLMQSMGDVAGYSAQLKVLALELSKIASDLRLLASGPRTGLDEIRLPAVQPGSSIMPGKINPSIPEMVNQVCFQVIGCDACVSTAAEHGQLELNVMMPVIGFNVLLTGTILTNAMEVFDQRCVRGLQANPEQCAYWVERSAALATALAPRIGYARAAELSKQSVADNVLIRDLVRREHVLPPDEIDAVLDLRRMTEIGVPGEAGVRGQGSGVRDQGSGVRDQGSEVRGQRSEASNQKPVVGAQKTKTRANKARAAGQKRKR